MSGGLSTSQRTHTLVVLSGLIHAAGRARQPLAPGLLHSLAACLASDGMLAAAAEHAAVRQQLLAAAVNAMAWAGAAAGGDAAVTLPLHVVLLQLYGSELAAATAAAATAAPSSGAGAAAAAAGGGGAGRRQGEGSKVWEALGTLAACCGAEGVEALTDRHATWLVGCLFPGAAAEGDVAAMDAGPGSGPGGASSSAFAWAPSPGDAAWLCVLRAVLLTASPAALRRLAAPLVGALRPLLTAAPAREDGGREEAPAGLRLALLGLVDSVLEDAERGTALAEGAGQVRTEGASGAGARVGNGCMTVQQRQQGRRGLPSGTVRYGCGILTTSEEVLTQLSVPLSTPRHAGPAARRADAAAGVAGRQDSRRRALRRRYRPGHTAGQRRQHQGRPHRRRRRLALPGIQPCRSC